MCILVGFNSKYPEVLFYGAPITAQRTLMDSSIGCLDKHGISIFVPENSICSEEEISDMHIHPCFTGPFQLPDDYEPASPAYLICHKVHFQKDIIVRMCHYANLRSKADCEQMTFLTASSTPKYEESKPVYHFKVNKAKGIFKPENQIGEIAIRHFCFKMIGKKRKRTESPEPSEGLEKKSKG